MKTFLIFALLAVVATVANANVQLDPIGQYQPQQPFTQPQQPFLQPQLFPQPQQPFSQEQYPFPQPQQPFPQPQQQFPGQQQPCMQQQQQQQQSFFQPILQQQLNPCREFLVQQCNPVGMVPFLRSQIMQQSSCQVMRQQCCQQLVQIPKHLRYPAIYSVVHAIIMQQQQQILRPYQQQVGQGFCQPQPQQVGQGFILPHQIAQFEEMRKFALQTLPVMCNVQVPLYYSTAPFGGISGF
ncbi:hypothetical protein ACQ4PT_012517 [Festuca glaucescens]